MISTFLILDNLLNALPLLFVGKGYTLTVDNVDLQVQATNQAYNNNQSFHWALGFMSVNRIGFHHLGEKPFIRPLVSRNDVQILKLKSY